MVKFFIKSVSLIVKNRTIAVHSYVHCIAMYINGSIFNETDIMYYEIKMKPFNFDMEGKKQFKCDIYQIEILIGYIGILYSYFFIF